MSPKSALRLQRNRSDSAAHTRSPAFTLLEVVVALAIFSVAMIVLTQSFMNGLFCKQILKKEDPHGGAIWFIRQNLLKIQHRKKVEEGGTLNLINGEKAEWDAKISETDIADLFCVQWTVNFDDSEADAPPKEDTVRTEKLYLFRPAWSDSIERSKLLEEKRIKLERWRSEHMRS